LLIFLVTIILGVVYGIEVGSVIGVATDNPALWESSGIASVAGTNISKSQSQKKEKLVKN